MSHTPGPWEYLDIGEIVAGENMDVTLCVMNDGTNSVHVLEVEANAELMAAAPDMLDALKAFVAAFRLPLRKDEADAISNAKAAIAKATGGAA